MIAGAAAFTVITTVATHVPPRLYVMVGKPAETPVTTPVAATTVADARLLLLHVPPVVASLRLMVLPGHTVVGPVIGDGGAFTVIDVEAVHPVPSV